MDNEFNGLIYALHYVKRIDCLCNHLSGYGGVSAQKGYASVLHQPVMTGLAFEIQNFLRHLICRRDGLGVGRVGPLGQDHLDELPGHIHVALFQ